MASVTSPVSLTIVVLTYNEERNLSACLESVAGWAGEIFVVDSGSTDHTVAIAERYGAKAVMHPFESHARQCPGHCATCHLLTSGLYAWTPISA
jgi:glycosyltransferase involved in cell wall biosynthesis